jgi:hypothetical protein
LIGDVRTVQLAAAAIACFMLAGAPASAQGVKIGVLADRWWAGARGELA